MRVRSGCWLLLAVAALAGCGKGAAQKQAELCAEAWKGGLSTVEAQTAQLTEAEPQLDARRKEIEKAGVAAEKRLAALTIRREEAQSAYPDKIKARVASAKMRLGTITPNREQSGKPLSTVRFDTEIQGEVKKVRKTLEALYEQPKAIFLEKVEVNITDERKGWAILKVQFRVHMLSEPAPAAPGDAGLPAGYSAALAWTPSPECAATPPGPEVEAARSALREKEAVARAVQTLETHAGLVKARTAIADDIVRRRDDDRAIWMAHADEIVEKARTSVTGLAELTFNAKGEPDWKM